MSNQNDDLKNKNEHVSGSASLDDEQRIKVLSPSMLVIKRFIRNKLAVAGMIIISAMFLFSFVGGWVSPYSEKDVFYHEDVMMKTYASATKSVEFRYRLFEGEDFSSIAVAQFMSARNKNQQSFSAQDVSYTYVEDGKDFYSIWAIDPYVNVVVNKKEGTVIKPVQGKPYTEELFNEASAALTAGQNTFTSGGVDYLVSGDESKWQFGTSKLVAFASTKIFDLYDAENTASTEFMYNAETAVIDGQTTFEADGKSYEIGANSTNPDIVTIFDVTNGRKEFANITDLVIQAFQTDIFLTIEYKAMLEKAIEENATEFTFDGELYRIDRKDTAYTVTSKQVTRLVDVYASPSAKHILGTDQYGFDVLTRLMYGGRISLLIGFIIVLIELFLGVILGGISGYFGGWIDNLIMRIVDIFNCIPSLPIIIIVGSVFDGLRMEPRLRIFYLMFILGFLGWPGIARVVRGQILSLREQEFMVATEATGISVYRRIFRHLVPNVIPQLIVIVTMSLGSVILTESTLSFLGLGVKFPFASWGNIISAVSDSYVMTSYWFVWIPAGILILITVLGFNFVGDGLRDAFDPKMKR